MIVEETMIDQVARKTGNTHDLIGSVNGIGTGVGAAKRAEVGEVAIHESKCMDIAIGNTRFADDRPQLVQAHSSAIGASEGSQIQYRSTGIQESMLIAIGEGGLASDYSCVVDGNRAAVRTAEGLQIDHRAIGIEKPMNCLIIGGVGQTNDLARGIQGLRGGVT